MKDLLEKILKVALIVFLIYIVICFLFVSSIYFARANEYCHDNGYDFARQKVLIFWPFYHIPTEHCCYNKELLTDNLGGTHYVSTPTTCHPV